MAKSGVQSMMENLGMSPEKMVDLLLQKFGLNVEEISVVIADIKINGPLMIQGILTRVDRMEQKMDIILACILNEKKAEAELLSIGDGENNDGGSSQSN